MSDSVELLKNWCLDAKGDPLPPEAEPLSNIHCGDLLNLLDDIQDQQAEIERLRAQVEEQHRCLQDCLDLLGDARSGFIGGSSPDLAWDQKRENVRRDIASFPSTERGQP